MERISVFDIFKIGVGPSSSHTMGPWKAVLISLKEIEDEGRLANVRKIVVDLYGSLAKTGKGHGTDVAVLMGLAGEDPVTTDVNAIAKKVENVRKEKTIAVAGKKKISFDPEKDIIFLKEQLLPFHPNAMRLHFTFDDDAVFSDTWYSIGGGFVSRGEANSTTGSAAQHLPYPVGSASELLAWCNGTRLSVPELVFENEKVWRTPEQIRKELLAIWETMKQCIYRGCHTEGILPGGLKVVRRAQPLNRKLLGEDPACQNADEWMRLIRSKSVSFQNILNWVSCFALAVNEENASFGRVVTAPTNGAAGVIPAVLQYFLCFCDHHGDDDIIRFLLTAGELGSIFKKGSTISAAMGGCQAEIGVSSAMAAGALTACLKGNPEQIVMAAEIAMEHHLGLTCDPIGGLVQIPCIERNTMGAMKAITASQLAMQGDPSSAKVSLDAVINTMWETAKDMNSKYKETADGGLAVNISVGLADC